MKWQLERYPEGQIKFTLETSEYDLSNISKNIQLHDIDLIDYFQDQSITLENILNILAIYAKHFENKV